MLLASAVAFVLRRVELGAEQLNRRIVFSEHDILSHAPITKLHVGGDGMSVAALCAAAIPESDNTAANLLLASFGGPAALTGFWRAIGDTRVERRQAWRPARYHVAYRDARKPPQIRTGRRPRTALAEDLHKMVGCEIGDKTGTGGYQTSNDIAVIWPFNRKPLVVTAYLTQGHGSDDGRDRMLADVGRSVAGKIASTPTVISHQPVCAIVTLYPRSYCFSS